MTMRGWLMLLALMLLALVASRAAHAVEGDVLRNLRAAMHLCTRLTIPEDPADWATLCATARTKWAILKTAALAARAAAIAAEPGEAATAIGAANAAGP